MSKKKPKPTEQELQVIAQAVAAGGAKQIAIAGETAGYIVEVSQGALGPKFRLHKTGVVFSPEISQAELKDGLDVVIGMKKGTRQANSALTWHQGEIMRKLRETPLGDAIIENTVAETGTDAREAMRAELLCEFFPEDQRDHRLSTWHYETAYKYKNKLPRATITKILGLAAEGEPDFVSTWEVGEGEAKRVATDRKPWTSARMKRDLDEAALMTAKPQTFRPASSAVAPETIAAEPSEPQPSGVFTGYLYVLDGGTVIRSPFLLLDAIEPICIIKSPDGVQVDGRGQPVNAEPAEVVVPEVLPPDEDGDPEDDDEPWDGSVSDEDPTDEEIEDAIGMGDESEDEMDETIYEEQPED